MSYKVKSLHLQVVDDAAQMAQVISGTATYSAVFWTVDGSFPPLLEEYFNLKAASGAKQSDGVTYADALVNLKTNPGAVYVLESASGIFKAFPEPPASEPMQSSKPKTKK